MRSQEDIQLIKALQFTVESLQANFDALMKDYDAAHAEVEQLKQVLHDARLENSGQAMLLERKQHIGKVTEMVRPEPSRLEIAAMLLQGLLPMHVNSTDVDAVALKLADRLIRAAKEGK